MILAATVNGRAVSTRSDRSSSAWPNAARGRLDAGMTLGVDQLIDWWARRKDHVHAGQRLRTQPFGVIADKQVTAGGGVEDTAQWPSTPTSVCASSTTIQCGTPGSARNSTTSGEIAQQLHAAGWADRRKVQHHAVPAPQAICDVAGIGAVGERSPTVLILCLTIGVGAVVSSLLGGLSSANPVWAFTTRGGLIELFGAGISTGKTPFSHEPRIAERMR